MRRRRAMFPETAFYVANYILSSTRTNVYEPPYYSRYGRAPILDTFCTPHQGKGGYWMSPQRHHLSGTTWRDPHRHHQVIFPGNTGFSDVISTQPAGYCRIRHSLMYEVQQTLSLFLNSGLTYPEIENPENPVPEQRIRVGSINPGWKYRWRNLKRQIRELRY